MSTAALRLSHFIYIEYITFYMQIYLYKSPYIVYKHFIYAM